MKKLLFALVAGVALSASAVVLDTASDIRGITFVGEGNGEYKPDTKPDKKPDGEGGGGQGGGEQGGGGGGGSSSSDDTTILSGVLTLNSGTNTLDGTETGGVLTSSSADENVILVQSNATLTISNYTLTKSGDTSSEDNSNFYALNAVVAAKTAGKVYIDHSELNSNASGANCLFASGSGSTIYAYKCNITSTKDSSRGLDATYEGTVIASKMTIDTAGDHCAALATDRGNGYISATASTLNTAGQGSPLIYSTGVIEVNSVTGTATGAQIAGIEGLSTIRIKNSDLTGSAEKASESVPNGVMIYQSMSGDSTEGVATFEVSESALTSTVKSGAMFYITNSKADIRIQDTDLSFDSTNNYLVIAAGNDGSHGWGNAGSNGAEVILTAIDQTLDGAISVDAISSLDLYLTNSTYTGTFVTTNSSPDINAYVGADSTWIVTSNCTLKSLTVVPGVTNVVDGDGKPVRIVNTSNVTLVEGDSEVEIVVSDYVSENVAITNMISDFEIDRTDFEAMYKYYFKPHPPENAIVKVKYGETYLTPDMDHKYWVDELGITVTIIYATETGYFFSDGTSTMSREVVFDTNKMDIYPLDGTVVVKAQAKSGATYYPTLKEALDNSKSRATVTLNDNITLEETLTITNSITLNLSTNVITLGSALTNAFIFASKSTTVSNGTINSSFETDVADSVMLCFADCAAKLKDLTIDGSGYETVICCTGSGEVSTDNVWVNGTLYGETSELVTPGVASDQYDDAQSATNAAEVINTDKANNIAIPEGVEDSAIDTYLSKVEATVTSDCRVVVDLTAAAKIDEQALVDAAVTSETAIVSFTSTNLTATIENTTAGLYYWIEGGVEANAITETGEAELSTNGGALELTKPELDATKGAAFFRFAAGVASPSN